MERMKARLGNDKRTANPTNDRQYVALGGVEHAYGSDALQTLDFYKAKTEAARAPLLIFVHGGGWKRGDKRNATGTDKVSHYTGLGYHMASFSVSAFSRVRLRSRASIKVCISNTVEYMPP